MIFLHPAIYFERYLHSSPEAWGRLEDEAGMARI